MSSPFGPLHLFVDPRARGARRAARELVDTLRSRDVAVDGVATPDPNETPAAVRAALADGVRYLVAVGGDATVHAVVNGMIDRDGPVAADAVLGVVAAGRTCDFARTFGLDRPVERVAGYLASDHVMPIDVGLVDYHDPRGCQARRAFVNIAQVGYGAEALRRARRYRALGRVGALLGAYAAIATLDRREAAVRVAHTEICVPVVNLVVANGQFLGNGMKIAPRALPDDGRFNVQVFTGERSQVFTMSSAIYRGEHLPHPNVVEYQSPVVAVDPQVPLAVEADGQVLGTTPATFALLDRALRLKI